MLEFIERLLSWLLLAFCIFMLLFTIVRLIVMIAYDFDVIAIFNLHHCSIY